MRFMELVILQPSPILYYLISLESKYIFLCALLSNTQNQSNGYILSKYGFFRHSTWCVNVMIQCVAFGVSYLGSPSLAWRPATVTEDFRSFPKRRMTIVKTELLHFKLFLFYHSQIILPIRVVQVKHRQGSRNVYNMYLTTTITTQRQHTDGSKRQATSTDHHCLGTCPNIAQISLVCPPQKKTRVAARTTLPLPHEPPHRNEPLPLTVFFIGPNT
jgi:hypothetical protein